MTLAIHVVVVVRKNILKQRRFLSLSQRMRPGFEYCFKSFVNQSETLRKIRITLL